MDGWKRENREAYDLVAEDWHRDHADDSWWVPGMRTFESMMAPGSRVLDAGCGGGTKARWLCERGHRVTGVDISERLVTIARREAPGADFRVMDMCDVDPELGTFDAVCAQASLLHLPHDAGRAAMAGWSHMVRRDGLLYVAVKEPREGQPAWERKVEKDYGYEYARWFSYWTGEELRYAAMLAGFLTIYAHSAPSGRTTWLQVIARKQ